MFSIRIYEFSEPEVEANRVVGRNTERLELLAWRVGGGAALARETIDFRVDATVLGPQVQVARGEVQRGRARAQIPARPALRQIPRRRELTPPDERCRLEEAVERLRRIVARGNDHRLLLERSARNDLAVHDLRVHQAVAVLAADAADALRVVVPLVAALVVEERRNAEPATEEIDAGLQRREIPRRGIPAEDRVRTDEHFVLRRVV